MIQNDDREAGFLVRVTDMVAHELRNVLATVKEHTEHVEDLISITGSDDTRAKERILESLAAIKEQVIRGSNLAQRINLFSQGHETAESELDLNELVEMLEPLAEPFSRKKGIRVNLIHPARPMVMVGNPLQILMILAGSMDFLAGLAGSRDTLEIRVSQRPGKGLMVSFTSASLQKGIRSDTWAPVEQHQWNELEALARSSSARVGLIADRGLLVVVFETEWI
ncbi:MAG: hypothetical protein RDU20_10420 [Desulfomonilaceae bacterium]|nr:hypothetical protein [Desulfomonilaceae bacterium]